MFRIICSAILVTSSKATRKGFPTAKAGFDVGDRVEYCPDKDYVIETTKGKITYGHRDADDACLKQVSRESGINLTLDRIRNDLKRSADRGNDVDRNGRIQTKYTWMKPNPFNPRDMSFASERHEMFFISASRTWTEYYGEDQINLRKRLICKREQMNTSQHLGSYPATHYVCDPKNFLRLFRLTVRDEKWRKATVISKLPQNRYEIRFDDSGCTQTVSAGDYLLERNHTNLRLEDRVVDAVNRISLYRGIAPPRVGYWNRCYGVGIRRSMAMDYKNKTTEVYVARILGSTRTEIEAEISEDKLPKQTIDLLADLEQALGDEFSKEYKNDGYHAKRRNPVFAHMEQKMDDRVLTVTCSETCWEEAKKDPVRMNKIRKEARLKKEKADESEIKARTKARLEKEEAERKEREVAEEEVRRAEEQLNARDRVSEVLLQYVKARDTNRFCARLDKMFTDLENKGMSFNKKHLEKMLEATTIKKKILFALRLVHSNRQAETANTQLTGFNNYFTKMLVTLKEAHEKAN